MLKTAVITCVLLASTIVGSLAADPRIQTFYDKSIATLAELSESMFAGEGEGSEIADKIISPDNILVVEDIQEQAEVYIKAFGQDEKLIEVVDFANRIRAKNNTLNATMLRLNMKGNSKFSRYAIKGKWRDYVEEDDGGTLCYAVISQGDMNVGFHGEPGKWLAAFVGGVYQGDVKTKWQIDGRQPYELTGSDDEYFGHHGFTGVDIKMLLEISKGNRLKIISSANSLSVDLNGSAVALSSFAECFQSLSAVGLPKTLPYGSRIGMEVDVVGATGVDMDLAEITVKHTRENAAKYCKEYLADNSEACIGRTLKQENVGQNAIANCRTGNFTNLFNQRFRFEGKNSNRANEFAPEFAIRDLSNDEILSDAPTSGYSTALAVFSVLCPEMVREASAEVREAPPKVQACYFNSLVDGATKIRFVDDGDNTVLVERNDVLYDTCTWGRNEEGTNIICNKIGSSPWKEEDGNVFFFGHKFEKRCD